MPPHIVPILIDGALVFVQDWTIGGLGVEIASAASAFFVSR